MTNAIMLWVIIGIVALITDILTSTFLFVWFTTGAIAAIIAEIFNCSFIVQLVVFIVVSGIFMIIGYPIAKKTIKKSVKPTPTREQTYIGKQFIAEEDILREGSVKIDGVYWNAINEGEMIQKGDKLIVTKVEGNKIIIKKI